MDLTLTDEQQMLRTTVREMLERFSSPDDVRAMEADPEGFRRDLWAELGRADLLGLTIGEAYGGAGQTALETVILYEELGRALCPSPHLVSAVLAAAVLREAGSDEQRRELLPRIASGEAIVTVAWLEPDAGWGPESVRLAVDGTVLDGTGLDGTKILVPFAASATHVLTLARTGTGPRDVMLALADPADLEITPMRTISGEPHSMVVYRTAAGRVVGPRDGGWDVWERAMTDGLIALAAYAIGGAQRAHELAVEYAKQRVQFDRPIGSFQGIAHPLAETAVEIEGGRVLTYEAAWARAEGRDATPLACMAKLYCADVFRRTTKVGQQVFGGIGFTTDIDMQLYFRRAKQLELSWWGPRYLEERIAAVELDSASPFVSVDAGVEA